MAYAFAVNNIHKCYANKVAQPYNLDFKIKCVHVQTWK